MSHTMSPSEVPATEPHRNDAERRRAMASSFLGSTVEMYDFLLYAAAAGLVFPQMFFGNLSPLMGTTLSFAILLIATLALDQHLLQTLEAVAITLFTGVLL